MILNAFDLNFYDLFVILQLVEAWNQKFKRLA